MSALLFAIRDSTGQFPSIYCLHCLLLSRSSPCSRSPDSSDNISLLCASGPIAHLRSYSILAPYFLAYKSLFCPQNKSSQSITEHDCSVTILLPFAPHRLLFPHSPSFFPAVISPFPSSTYFASITFNVFSSLLTMALWNAAGTRIAQSPRPTRCLRRLLQAAVSIITANRINSIVGMLSSRKRAMNIHENK